MTMPISNLTGFFGTKDSQMQLINFGIKNCNKCDCSNPKVTTFGRGSLDSEVMLIGESPWIKDVWLKLQQEELDMLLEKKYGDRTSFGDEAGKVLSQILKLAGLDENKVYVTNIVKCSLKNNLKPNKQDAIACSYYLFAEIAIVQPKVVLAASHAARDFFKVEPGGTLKTIDNYYVVGVYHPSYVARYPGMMEKTVKQYKKALRYLK
jgi:uracil-DNA glycosylase family 4